MVIATTALLARMPHPSEAEEVTFDRARVTSTDWASYPILAFPDVPQLDIALMDRRH